MDPITNLADLAAAPAAAPANPNPGATPPAAAAPANVNFPENWKDALDEEIKKDPSMAVITDFKNLAKSYVHAQKLIGRDKIPVPGKNATDEDWKNVYQKLGLPEKDKYDVKFPETYNKDFQEKFKETLHGAGILPTQAQKLVDFYNGHIEQEFGRADETRKAAYDKEMNALKVEWGEGYNKNLQTAAHTFKKLVDPETIQYLDQKGFTKDPRIFKVFAKIGEMLGEDKVVDPKGAGGFTPSDINEKITTIMGDKTGAYWNKTHPGHKAAVEQVQQYHQMLGRF